MLLSLRVLSYVDVFNCFRFVNSTGATRNPRRRIEITVVSECAMVGDDRKHHCTTVISRGICYRIT